MPFKEQWRTTVVHRNAGLTLVRIGRCVVRLWSTLTLLDGMNSKSHIWSARRTLAHAAVADSTQWKEPSEAS